MRKMEVTSYLKSNNSVHYFHKQPREYRTEVKDHERHIINEAILKHEQHQ